MPEEMVESLYNPRSVTASRHSPPGESCEAGLVLVVFLRIIT